MSSVTSAIVRESTEYHTIGIGDLQLESGAILRDVQIFVETCGKLRPTRDNVILVCHALTGDARAVGTEEEPGWWRGLIGPGCWVDTEQYYVITMNVIGGCGGSTGPTSINPDTGQPYRWDFPSVTIRDMVKAQFYCLRQMGFSRVHAVIGGSVGGMQSLEWAVMYPFFARKIVTIAASSQLSPMAIAYNDIGRKAIQSDPNWKDGYYEPGEGPKDGLAIARMVGMVTYRTEMLFEERFGRELRSAGAVTDPDALFEVESYLRYQGEKLVKRFDANSYLYLLKAMDTHDVGRGRGGIDEAFRRIEADVFIVGIEEDTLFPIRLQRDIHERLTALNKNSKLVTISSIYGHDAFLVSFDSWGEQLQQFLKM